MYPIYNLLNEFVLVTALRNMMEELHNLDVPFVSFIHVWIKIEFAKSQNFLVFSLFKCVEVINTPKRIHEHQNVK